MTDVWSASTAGSDTRQRAARRRSVVARSLAVRLVVGVAVLSATLLLSVAPSGGDPLSSQISSLQAQAAQLSQQMVLEQLQIGGYQQQYAAAADRAAQDQAQLAEIGDRIATYESRIRQDEEHLARAAVRDYVETGGSTAVSDALFSSQSAAITRAVYERVVTGDLTTDLDRLQSDRHALAVEQVAQQSLVAQDQSAQSQASTLLADAQSTEATLQQQDASVTGQLATAVVQAQAEQAAATAAALAAAESVPASGAGSGSSAGSGATTGSASSTGGAVPSLPPFLRCVVQAESGSNYGAVSPTGQYMGAFQFSQATWNEAAQLAGRPDLIGVAPDTASMADQDSLAIALYAADGEQPWYDPCRTA